ncbi:hypothetical protein [Escherichia coli]|uniref:Secreted protein n=2 Tax=Enterobacteriaceae TaxID=543 RepID=A0ABC8E8E4_ECOLX|nr:hypothetical protein [Escherichia coli]EAT1718372.1 hypothetical protein [Salmonella enterica]EGI9251165.1 hypothetical protein [Salmonella enterica subsp. enterica serovar Typhimurium]HAE4638697.1 hypothetical protein [Salmonella enterica subsp. enterica serovar Muenchen]EBH7536165.1 hypothetical protein [Salmonella enterica]ECJ0394298.1 hypothetical protein [Salmonella enterica]
MKIIALIFCIFPVTSFASSENLDHVFIKAFQAAMASSLCTDVANITKDTQPEKELEPLIKICAEKGEQSRAILDAYTNAEHT